MFDVVISVSVIVLMLITHSIVLNYGLRLGKAMQKDIPPAPLAETVRKVYKMVKKTDEEKERKKREDPGKPIGMYD